MNMKRLLTLALLPLLTATASAVTVIPNKTLVHGTVLEYCSSVKPLPKNGQISRPHYRIVLQVQTAEPIGDSPNFLQGKEGEEIDIQSAVPFEPGLLGKKVRAIVEYRGDERGGWFVLRKVELEK